MLYKNRYERRKKDLLEDKNINPKNRKVIAQFLEFQEYRLKRRNSLPEVDERSYKTLSGYVGRIKNLNTWFKNKDWATLKKTEIKKLIDDLEDGLIKTQKGTRFVDRSLYYQMMQGKLFALVKKHQFVREIIEENSIVGRKDENQVRFITEEDFRKIVDCAITPEQRCLLWLAFDVGENIGSLLELEKQDFKRQMNEHTKDPEYLVILPKDKLKRSRTARSEITNYPETVKYLDLVLNNLEEDKNGLHGVDKLFKFGDSVAKRFLLRAVKKAKVRCQPEGNNVTWKDLRSSMSCDLLKKGWTRDEVNARLGHKPSSRIIDRYINFLAIDRGVPKKKIFDNVLQKVNVELEEAKNREKLYQVREQTMKEQIEKMNQRLEAVENDYDVADKTGFQITIPSEYYEGFSPQIEKTISQLNKTFSGKKFEELKASRKKMMQEEK